MCVKCVDMSLSDAPVLKPENYEKWKNNMMLHLEAISDEMIYVINEGPSKITQLKQVTELSDGRKASDKEDEEEEPPASDSGCVAHGSIMYEDKPRELWTSEDAKRHRLDGQAHNIIIRSTPEHIQCKLWGVKTAKVAWQLIEEICAGTEKTKENKFEVLKLKFQTSNKVPLKL